MFIWMTHIIHYTDYSNIPTQMKISYMFPKEQPHKIHEVKLVGLITGNSYLHGYCRFKFFNNYMIKCVYIDGYRILGSRICRHHAVHSKLYNFEQII